MRYAIANKSDGGRFEKSCLFEIYYDETAHIIIIIIL